VCNLVKKLRDPRCQLHPSKNCKVAKRKIYAKLQKKAKTKHLLWDWDTFIQSIFVNKVATVRLGKNSKGKILNHLKSMGVLDRSSYAWRIFAVFFTK